MALRHLPSHILSHVAKDVLKRVGDDGLYPFLDELPQLDETVDSRDEGVSASLWHTQNLLFGEQLRLVNAEIFEFQAGGDVLVIHALRVRLALHHRQRLNPVSGKGGRHGSEGPCS